MVQVSIFPQGTRVRVRKGSLPMDSSLIGRVGLVIRHAGRARPPKVMVQLEGEEKLRAFHDVELEALATAVSVTETGADEDGTSGAGS